MLIDVHTHIYLRPYIEALALRGTVPRVIRDDSGEHLVIFPDEAERLGATRPMPTSFYEPQQKLAFMASAGIDVSVVSLGNPWVDPFDAPDAVRLASSINDELAQLAQDHAAIETLGVLPVQDTRAAVREVERIATSTPLIGVILSTRPAGGHVDDAHMDPIWEALQRHEVPVLLHPHYALGYDWMAGHGHAMPLALAFPFETSTAATRMILGGVVDRYPGLQVILSHAGGTLPYLMGRLEACISADDIADRRRCRGVEDYLRWFYYDAITYHPGPLRLLLDVVGPNRCMFGTDHPFGIADPAAGVRTIDAVTTTPQAREAIRSATAAHWIETGRLPG
jgi:predicted TIM-barrel fold metal-dependent hydrolase